MTDRLRILAIASALAAGATVLYFARGAHLLQVERPDLGLLPISDAGFALQLAALLAGIVLVHLVPRGTASWVLVLEGAICVLAWGVAGLVFLGGVLLYGALLEARRLRRWRFVLALGLVGLLDACAWTRVSALAHVFSMIFTLRLLVYAYDRWQCEDEPTSVRRFLVFALCGPLVVVPPFMSVVPLFGDFEQRFRPGLSASRLRQVGKHALLAVVCGAARVGIARAGFVGELHDFEAMFGRLLASMLGLATIGHALVALLLLHGIEERLPTWRPLLATRMVELWHRLSVHLKDAQVFLFYTPAVLRLRRKPRYLAIASATFWTLVVGNTLLHVVARYVFLDDGLARTGWGLLANAILAVVLAIELCLDERQGGRKPQRTWLAQTVGWVYTMTVAAFVATL